jgi:hypothetical protein
VAQLTALAAAKPVRRRAVVGIEDGFKEAHSSIALLVLAQNKPLPLVAWLTEIVNEV